MKGAKYLKRLLFLQQFRSAKFFFRPSPQAKIDSKCGTEALLCYLEQSESCTIGNDFWRNKNTIGIWFFSKLKSNFFRIPKGIEESWTWFWVSRMTKQCFCIVLWKDSFQRHSKVCNKGHKQRQCKQNKGRETKEFDASARYRKTHFCSTI